MRFIDPKTDFAFKRIFGSEDSQAALISFINAALELKGERLVESVEIKNPYNTRHLPIEKESIVDISCTDRSGIQYLVEMQVEKVKGFANRMLYNLAKCYSGQLLRGDDYPKLNDVVLIAVMDFALFKEMEAWHSLFVMKEKRINYAPFNQFRLCCLELAKFKKVEGELSGMMDKWAYFLKEVDALEVRPEVLGDADFDVAFEKAEMCKLSLEEKEAYDVSIQKARDKRGMIAEGVDKGFKKGLKQGREQGREEGIRQVARNMLAAGSAPELVTKATGLSLAEVKKLM